MNKINPIVQQIELKIDEIYQDRSLASGFLDIPKEPDALDRYIQLQQDAKINSGVRYIALDIIAQKYQFYPSSAEKQKITDVIGQALTDCSLQQTFDDIQLLKFNYTDIYQADPVAFDRIDKILRSKLGLPPIIATSLQSQPATTIIQTPSVLPPEPPRPTSVSPATSAPPKNNSILPITIGMVIGAGLIGLWSFSLGQKTSTISQTAVNPIQSPIPSNNQNPISINTPILVLKSTPTTTPQPAPIPIPTPTSIPTPNQINANANPPSTFIVNHYQNINGRNYQLTWNELTRNFQTKKTSYEKGWIEYVKWWQSVDRVDVNNTKVISQNQDRAVVDVKLRYLIQSGRYTYSSLRFSLINNSDRNSWLIDNIVHK